MFLPRLRDQHDSGIKLQDGLYKSEMLQLEKRPEPMQEAGGVLAFC